MESKAGFSAVGQRYLVDANMEGMTGPLRSLGINARGVSELGVPAGAKDAAIRSLADSVGAKVLTRDVGHDIGGGFGKSGVTIPSRITRPEEVKRYIVIYESENKK